MASDLNSVTIVGRLTRDAELKHIASGTALCKFSIANNAYAGAGKEDHVNFIDCTLWGKRAESLSGYLTKGTQVAIQGSLKQDRWEDSGQKRSKVEINVSDLQLLGSKRSSDSQGSYSQPQGGGYSQSQTSPYEEEDSSTVAEQVDFDDDDVPF